MIHRRKLVAGNWKMNGLRASLGEARAIADQLAAHPGVDAVLCPPATLLAAMAAETEASALRIGGQDCHAEAKGAFTGSISAAMIVDAGGEFVILGHSERRHHFSETSEMVQAKVAMAWSEGLHTIVCVGEPMLGRQAGRAEMFIVDQVKRSLPRPVRWDLLTIAYEPVWAIGTGITPTPEQVSDIHRAIRALLVPIDAQAAARTRILYGGSVSGSNAAQLFAAGDVDGGLIGGASLKAADFMPIIAAAAACG